MLWRAGFQALAHALGTSVVITMLLEQLDRPLTCLDRLLSGHAGSLLPPFSPPWFAVTVPLRVVTTAEDQTGAEINHAHLLDRRWTGGDSRSPNLRRHLVGIGRGALLLRRECHRRVDDHF